MDQIFTEIRETARKEAEQLVSRARRVAEREQQHAREAAAAKQAAHRAACEREAALREERAAARRISDARREELAQHDLLITRVFARALDTLRSMPRDRRYEDWIRRMAAAALEQFPHGDAEAVCNGRDTDCVGRALRGLPVTLAADKADIAGGIVIRSKDGRVTLDCSVEAVLARAQDQLRDEVMKQLCEV